MVFCPSGGTASSPPPHLSGLPWDDRCSRPFSWSLSETMDVPASCFPPNRCTQRCFTSAAQGPAQLHVAPMAVPSGFCLPAPHPAPRRLSAALAAVLRKSSTPSQAWGHSPGRRSWYCPSRRLQRARPPSAQFQLASCLEPPENPSCHPGFLLTYDTTSLNSSEGSWSRQPFPSPCRVTVAGTDLRFCTENWGHSQT